MRFFLSLLLIGCSSQTAADALEDHKWSRADRVVLYSPHFDLIPAPYGYGNNCPSQPLQLYGFENTSRHSDAALRLRVLVPTDPRIVKGLVPFRNVPVRLPRRWLDDRFEELPEAPAWQVVTDSAGAALLRVPAGVYELEVRSGAPLGRGVIQVRPGAQDSLQIYLLPGAAC